MIDANAATTITCTFVVIMAAIAVSFAIVRIVKGPTDTDRIIGLDILFSTALFVGIICEALSIKGWATSWKVGLSYCSGALAAIAGIVFVVAVAVPGLMWLTSPVTRQGWSGIGGAVAGLLVALVTGWVIAIVLAPAAIVGMPVGFVSAAESKDLIAELDDVPWIIIRGRKGGSTLVVAAIHALLGLAEARQLQALQG